MQRFSIHDGPGLRTTVFFKGCSLDCPWCQNPESIDPHLEMAFYAQRCLGCGRCREFCTRGAILFDEAGRIDWSKCNICGECVAECPGGALSLVGREVTGRNWQGMSGGPFLLRCFRGRHHLSGGEPVLQSGFLAEFLPLLKESGIHVLLETAGHYSWARLRQLLKMLDEVYYDYKLPGPIEYRNVVGGDQELILENLVNLLALQVPTTVRVPVVPGYNTAPDQVSRTGRTLFSVGVREIQLLKYNHLWEAKIPGLRVVRGTLGRLDAGLDYEQVMELYDRTGLTVRPFS